MNSGRGIFRFIFPVLLLAIAQHAYGQKSVFLSNIEKSYVAENYQQNSLMYVDPVGDAHLIRRLDTIPMKLTKILFGRMQFPQSKDEKRLEDAVLNDEPLVIGKSLPFDADRLLNKCAEIMKSHFPDIVPTLGEEHKWSPEAEEYLPHAFWHRLGLHIAGKQQDFPTPLWGRSKLFLCLACGWTSRYCVTGTEKSLKSYILSRPDQSVMPHELFEKSYVLNGGDIYLTFLACENVLTTDPHRKARAKDPIQQKLAYIRHDSRKAGDNYGAWYHLFGIALYGMLRPELQSLVVADAESIGSFFIEGPDKQEDYINHYGAIFGQGFRKMIENAGWILRAGENGRTDYLLPNDL